MWPICVNVLVGLVIVSLAAVIVLLLFKKWYLGRDMYVFSALNEQSLALASDVQKNHKGAMLVFTGIAGDKKESTATLLREAKALGAVCLKRDILCLPLKLHDPAKVLRFFAISEDESENIDHTLKLLEKYKERKNTHLYVFSTKTEGELLMNAADKGVVKVRRIHPIRCLIHQTLYENGGILFDSAWAEQDGKKCISAVVVGMGNYGKEMVKALAWYGQMEGYSLQIDGFDKDVLAEEKFRALAPELMSEEYNGVSIPGEAQYKIAIHDNLDVQEEAFVQQISQLKNTSYVLVALGDDSLNMETAVNLRMAYERMGIHPVIQAIVYNSRQKKALEGVRNFQGQSYDIDFIGDIESTYTERVILSTELEECALKQHKTWGAEETFWTCEYNYRSSLASAMHIKARIHCGIPGAEKCREELTEEESAAIEILEHRRWNAYLRAEGYVYSGSKEKSSRNDLGKMHHNLVKYADLSEEDKRKDLRVGGSPK